MISSSEKCGSKVFYKKFTGFYNSIFRFILNFRSWACPSLPHSLRPGSLRSLLSFLQAKKDIRYHRSRGKPSFQHLSEDNKLFHTVSILENLFSCRLFQSVDSTTENIPDFPVRIFLLRIPKTREKNRF
ncbi:hypothetical protein SAMN05444408_1203 [Chryseobacterium takakiae]|uniref:Uncharacterized protein n=1 Tax=Chryseobacterium takakiae TaxID=1302685 RepID=A0A1M5BKR0_9FLAO|nr:hypothetical protein SAMN05444408_1203 [Chryseobacterium takakiae]